MQHLPVCVYTKPDEAPWPCPLHPYLCYFTDFTFEILSAHFKTATENMYWSYADVSTKYLHTRGKILRVTPDKVRKNSKNWDTIMITVIVVKVERYGFTLPE